jgi:hypothetical protein
METEISDQDANTTTQKPSSSVRENGVEGGPQPGNIIPRPGILGHFRAL